MISIEKSLERFRDYDDPIKDNFAGAVVKRYIFVKTAYRIVRIELTDIFYLEGARDYVIIHTIKEQVLTLQSMKSLEEQLPPDQFIRVHKSYLIAIGRIDFIERSRISINNQLIPVSDTYKVRLLNQLKI